MVCGSPWRVCVAALTQRFVPSHGRAAQSIQCASGEAATAVTAATWVGRLFPHAQPAVLKLTALGLGSRSLGPGLGPDSGPDPSCRSEEHTSELQSLMRTSYAVFCLKKKTHNHTSTTNSITQSTYRPYH